MLETTVKTFARFFAKITNKIGSDNRLNISGKPAAARMEIQTLVRKVDFDALVDLPFALPTAVAGLVFATLYVPNGWLGQFLDPIGIKAAYSKLGIVLVGDEDLRDVALGGDAQTGPLAAQRLGELGEGRHVFCGPYPVALCARSITR